MANTLRFPNVTQQVFQRIVNNLVAVIPGSTTPVQHKDGTVRGRAEHTDDFGGKEGTIAVDYMWNPLESVLVMDIERPFWVPLDPIQQAITQQVNEARAMALMGR